MFHSIKPLILSFVVSITQKETSSAFSYHNESISILKHSLNLMKNHEKFDNNFSEIIYQSIDEAETSEQALNSFCKSIRQMDITHSGDLDMILYNLFKIKEVHYLMNNIFKFIFDLIKNNKLLKKENEEDINYVKRLVEEYTFSYI